MDAGGNAFTNVLDGLNRVKMTTGPAVSTVIEQYNVLNNTQTYKTNLLQHSVINFYDAAGLVASSVNALGETNLTSLDVLGRPTSTLVYGSSGVLVREKYLAYSADQNSVTVTDGSGVNAISHTTWTDDDGHTVLSIAYPSSGATEFTLNRYDMAGNLVSSQHNSSAGGSIANWTTSARPMTAWTGSSKRLTATMRSQLTPTIH